VKRRRSDRKREGSRANASCFKVGEREASAQRGKGGIVAQKGGREGFMGGGILEKGGEGGSAVRWGLAAERRWEKRDACVQESLGGFLARRRSGGVNHGMKVQRAGQKGEKVRMLVKKET